VGSPEGFTFETRKSGDVVIRHFGRLATVLRGKQALRFVADAEAGNVDLQSRMARLTGNYKRGNESRR
jgi:hypothetical protein